MYNNLYVNQLAMSLTTPTENSTYTDVDTTNIVKRITNLETQLVNANKRISILEKHLKPNTSEKHQEAINKSDISSDNKYGIVQFDGGSRGNPGLCGSGYVIHYCSNSWDIDSQSKSITGGEIVSLNETNNYAEYKALILALECALNLKFTDIKVQGDSKLVINQVQGIWRCGDKLHDLYVDASLLLGKFNSCIIEHIPREKNKIADNMANKLMNQYTIEMK